MRRNDPAIGIGLERALFLIGLLLLAHPLLSRRYFFTVDGPSHVYDAWLILQLFHPSPGIHPLWELNPLPVPNWTGHGLLALLMTTVEPQEALKVVHLTCVLGFVLAFRSVVAQRCKGPLWLSYLAFPFAFSVPFTMGYYNFALALPLVMLIIRQWRRITEQGRTKAGWSVLAALLVACYFSHLMPYLFVVLWLAAQLIEAWCRAFLAKGDSIDKELLRRTFFLCLAILPSLIFLAWYLVGSPDSPVWAGPPKDRLEQVWKPFVMVERIPELILWVAALYLVLLVFIAGFRHADPARVRVARRPGTIAARLYATTMLALIFFLPDGFGKGSDILFRLSVLVHIAFLVAIPIVAMAPRWGVALVAAALLITFGQQETRSPHVEQYADTLKSATEVCSAGPPGRTVSFIWLDWTYAHLPELGFTCSKAIDHTHYELSLAHFPLRWRPEYKERVTRAPPDPLDALGGLSGVRGAILRASDEVVVIGEPRDDRQRELIQLLVRELAVSHTEGPGNGICRVLWRNKFRDGRDRSFGDRGPRNRIPSRKSAQANEAFRERGHNDCCFGR